MQVLSHSDIVTLFVALGVLLLMARLLGEVAKLLHQPAVLGEILAGILLGPTVLGAIYPDIMAWIFPAQGPAAAGLQAITVVGVVMFLLVAGMEVDLSMVWRQGRSVLTIGPAGLIFPFVIGFGAGWYAPDLFGKTVEAPRFVFALFLATALSISALPVIAKILLDLKLFRTDFGMLLISSAILDDLSGWIVFSIVLALMSDTGSHLMGAMGAVPLVLTFAAFYLTVGRWLIDRSLPWILAHLSWPGGVIGLILVMTFFAAAFTEWIGIHAIFGAFLTGVAFGDSRHLREHTRATLDHFISFIFAPLFFASIGLRINFIQHFDIVLVVLVILIATLGKVGGCGIGARWSGLSVRESWAIGIGMNARGAMEIILGLLALQAGVIGERMFVALVVMALATSMASGTLIQRILRSEKAAGIADFISARHFVAPLRSRTAREVVTELARAACEGIKLDFTEVTAAVLAREELFSTALGHGVAVPHARLEDLKHPVIAVGLSGEGVDFNAPDGRPARLIFLILTPKSNTKIQLEILAAIGRLFHNPALVEQALATGTYTQFRALLNSVTGEGKNNQ